MSVIGNSIFLGQEGNSYSGDYAYFDMQPIIASSAFQNTTITNAFFSKCTTIESYAFYKCTALVSYSFPECTSIGSWAFTSTKISIAYFPKCTYIYQVGSQILTVFQNCSQLKVLSFPAFSYISSYLFANNTTITDAYFSNCTNIKSYAFQNCKALVNYSFPKCTTIEGYAFYNCTALMNCLFPECTSIGTYAFGNTKISIAYFPKCTYIYQVGNYSTTVFYNCSQLKVLSFPALPNIWSSLFASHTTVTDAYFSNCSIIQPYAFYNCTALTKLVLTRSQLITLQNQNALSATNAALSIYVPSNLVNSYKTATNWTYYSNKITSYIE